MKDLLLSPGPTQPKLPRFSQPVSSPKGYSAKDIFLCPEESRFYSQCLEKMVLSQSPDSETVVEFGSGDGKAVIHSLLNSSFNGMIHGYELNPIACRMAQSYIQQQGLTGRYTIHHSCFFEGLKQTPASCLIANPPYIPAPDNNILMPELYGGRDGADITKALLAVGCEQVLLMVSAYANPIETIHYAHTQDYQVVDFMVAPLLFGYYSSEPKVKHWIAKLRSQKKAFYSANVYFLTGVLFKKRHCSGVDLSNELLKVMTAL